MVNPRSFVLSDIDAAYSRYDAVFVGEVVGVVPTHSTWENVTFRVSERLKGNVDEHVLLPVYKGDLCRPNASLGTRYIVFAVRPLFAMNSIHQLSGLGSSARPPAPWDGDYILRVTVEVDSTHAPYAEHLVSVLAKLRALRADYEEE
jgi:hypothetical protein